MRGPKTNSTGKVKKKKNQDGWDEKGGKSGREVDSNFKQKAYLFSRIVQRSKKYMCCPDYRKVKNQWGKELKVEQWPAELQERLSSAGSRRRGGWALLVRRAMAWRYIREDPPAAHWTDSRDFTFSVRCIRKWGEKSGAKRDGERGTGNKGGPREVAEQLKKNVGRGAANELRRLDKHVRLKSISHSERRPDQVFSQLGLMQFGETELLSLEKLLKTAALDKNFWSCSHTVTQCIKR